MNCHIIFSLVLKNKKCNSFREHLIICSVPTNYSCNGQQSAVLQIVF